MALGFYQDRGRLIQLIDCTAKFELPAFSSTLPVSRTPNRSLPRDCHREECARRGVWPLGHRHTTRPYRRAARRLQFER